VSISRIIIVGLGSIGKRHLELARKIFPFALIKVFRHKLDQNIKISADDIVYSMDEVINFRPQIAVIANPAPFHIEVAKKLAKFGVHLLIEKPLSDSVKDVGSLLNECVKSNSILQVGYNLRFDSSLIFFRNKLNEGIIGEILSVRCEAGQYLPSWRPGKNYVNTVSALKELGGGVLLELSHEFDYLRWIFGEVDWVRALIMKQSLLCIDVEDAAHIIIGFLPNNGRQLIGSLNIDFIRHDSTRTCTAIGENGSLQWNCLKGEVLFFGKNSNSWVKINVRTDPFENSYLNEWIEFINCIQENKSPLVNGIDGLRVLQIIDAVRQASKTGGQISISRLNS